MLILDLQRLLFAFLLVLIAALWAVPWLERWLRRRAGGQLVLRGLGEMGSVLEQAPFGLLLLEGSFTCRYANPYARRLLGLASPSCRLSEAPWVYLLEADRVAVRQKEAAPSRFRIVPIPSSQSDQSDQPDQSKQFVHWWVTPLGGLDLVFLLDVTTQQRAEEAARSLINDLSHELRTPLATILTHLEVLSLSNISQEIGQQSIHLLKAEVRRMVRLVNLMLELGRLETSAEIERRPLDLLALVEEVVAQVTTQAKERQITLSLEADTPLPLVMGDGDRLRQVYLNLLDNAVKYSRPGDQVLVSLGREDDGIRCVVRDNGPGIPAKHLPHLTRRFYRVAPQEVEGSGLGLALVEEILRRHQSRLEIESHTEGEETGTSVRFLLPTVNVERDA